MKNTTKIKYLSWKLRRERIRVLKPTLGIIKNSILLILRTGIPENKREVENLKYAISLYEKNIQRLEVYVSTAREYVKGDE